jgi:hypothetical protein
MDRLVSRNLQNIFKDILRTFIPIIRSPRHSTPCDLRFQKNLNNIGEIAVTDRIVMAVEKEKTCMRARKSEKFYLPKNYATGVPSLSAP